MRAPEPLYMVEARALRDHEAAQECARRYAVRCDPLASAAHRKKLERAYLMGLLGDTDSWQHGRGGNFAAPLRRAYRFGEMVRANLMGRANLGGTMRTPRSSVPQADGAR